jgi:hypothetical protein
MLLLQNICECPKLLKKNFLLILHVTFIYLFIAACISFYETFPLDVMTGVTYFFSTWQALYLLLTEKIFAYRFKQDPELTSSLRLACC